jgi:amino acid transporter
VRVANALRIVSVVVVAKALLIGVVYWRRAEKLGRPIHIGTASWAGLIAVLAVAVAVALTVHVAARHPLGWRGRLR